MKNTYRAGKIRVTAVVSLVLIAAMLLSAASVFAEEAQVSKNGITKIEDLNGKNIGVQTGVLYEDLIKDSLQDEEWYYYKMPNDMILALETGIVDSYLIEEVGYFAQKYEHPELMRLEESAGYCDFAVIVGNREGRQQLLYSQLQEFIADRKASGWLDELYSYWVKNWNPETCKIESVPETTGENGTVSIAIEGGYEPFSFESDGQFTGYDVEFMMNFCAAYGYSWDFRSMEFDSIAIGVLANVYDFGMNIVVDEERADASLLSDPYYRCDVVFVVEAEQESSQSFFEEFKDNLYKTFVKDNRWKLFLEGSLTTMRITVLSVIIGTLLGFGAYMLCRHGNKAACRITGFVTALIDGIPTVVFLMLLAFVVLADTGLSLEGISVTGFSLIFGCGMYDMLCVGCNAVSKGQTEASRALGYGDSQSFFRIVLPQAAIHFLPIYKNDVISLLKETSVVGYIAVMDLTKMGDIVRGRTYQAFFSLITITVIYFLLEFIFYFLLGLVEKKLNTRHRTKDQILRGIKEAE